MKDLLVMKFGGTSMGSAERIKVAAEIASEASRTRPVALVVSAMSKVTDLMFDSLRHAEGGDRTGLAANVQKLRRQHAETCSSLLKGAAASETLCSVDSLISEFDRIATGISMLGVRPPRSVDEAVAIGEKLSASMIAAYLQSHGVKAAMVSGSDVIITDAIFGNASPVMRPTRKRAQEVVGPLLEQGILPVMTGFNGATPDGRPTTLGRGGSDLSAAVLAAALDASELWIWSDVDGIMTADPRLVRDAAVLDAITYREAAELAYNGAKVLHPRTLAPLIEKEIPVWSKNSFAPLKPGTRIVGTVDVPAGPRAVTSMANVALVSIEPASASMVGTRLMARALEGLAGSNVELLLLSSSSYRQSFCFLVRKDELAVTIDSLERYLALELAHGYMKPIEVDEDIGLLAVVGEGMQGTPGIAGRIFTAISRENVNIIAIAQGSSELTIGIVVARSGLEKAVQAVHAECSMGVAVGANSAH